MLNPTPDETAFFRGLTAHVPSLQDWYHADADGTPWMTVSFDVVLAGENGVRATWRMDYDGRELVGGRSPGSLNWDDDVRGRETGMPLEPPSGLVVVVDSVEEAVDVAASWFAERLDRIE